jgi:CRISPR-associated protein Csm1
MENSIDEILVKGDVSGIQDFIFNVKSDGAARELKGRSFFIKLLIEVAIKYIFDNAGIVGSEINKSKISTSGGNFIIKLPATKKDVVDQAQRIFTESLQFTGLNISIVSVVYDENDYSGSIQKLNAKTRESKLQFYTDNYSFFEPHEKSEHLKTAWNTITDKIKNNTHFDIKKLPGSSNSILQIGKVELAGYKVEFNQTGSFKLDNYLESLFPLYRNNVKTFEDLAKFGSTYNGANKLGILAMDVDGLGKVVEEIKSPVEHSDFDNELKQFFNKKLREMINSHFWNNVYTVTAGGDDSFFVGKWNTMLDLANAINKAFTQHEIFKAKHLSISAGLVIIDPKFPVIRFAELAERALKKAKYKYDTKGNICLFDEVIKWGKLTNINELRKRFRSSKISGSLLAKARLTAINGLENAVKLEDFWKMSYYLRDITDPQIIKSIERNISKSTEATSILEKRNYRLITPIASRFAELDKR